MLPRTNPSQLNQLDEYTGTNLVIRGQSTTVQPAQSLVAKQTSNNTTPVKARWITKQYLPVEGKHVLGS